MATGKSYPWSYFARFPLEPTATLAPRGPNDSDPPIVKPSASSPCKTVDDYTVGFSKPSDLARVKSSGQIKLSETKLIKEIKDKAYVPGISRVIQSLHFFYCLFCKFRGLAVDRRAPTTAFPYGIKLPAAERPNIVNQTAVVFL